MLSVEGHKAVSLTVMFIVTFACSMLALYVRNVFFKHFNNANSKIILSGCLCFGAGVLMSTVFLHILPETRSTIDIAMEDNFLATTTYPIAEVMLCAGFFLVYFIEETVHSCLERHHFKHHHHDHSDMQMSYNEPKSCEEAKIKAQVARKSVDRCSELRESAVSRRSVISLAVFTTSHGNVNEGNTNDNEYVDTMESGSLPNGSQTELQKPSSNSISLVSTAMAVIALCFHGLMEGMSLGLEADSRDIWILFGALSSHKIFISFTMSMELLEVGVSMRHFLLSMFIFSIASPVGGLIGSLVAVYTAEQNTAASNLTPAFLQSISGGTILYVTFCEVLERERAKDGRGHLKLLALMLGFGVLAGLEAVGGHEHGHDDHSTTESSMIRFS